jgi:hypothetical protein
MVERRRMLLLRLLPLGPFPAAAQVATRQMRTLSWSKSTMSAVSSALRSQPHCAPFRVVAVALGALGGVLVFAAVVEEGDLLAVACGSPQLPNSLRLVVVWLLC